LSSSIDVGLATTWFVTNLNESATYYFAVKACNAAGCSSPSSVVSGPARGLTPMLTNDFTGDRRSELAVWRPGTGTWFTRSSAPNGGPGLQVNWGSGSASDVPVIGDYDGDGETDPAVWR